MDWISETLQANGTLKNKLNITDHDKLQELEFRITQIKYRDPPKIEIEDVSDLNNIHQWLFSDLYDWAGQYRPGDFGKGQTTFLPRDRFGFAIQDLNQQIKHIRDHDYPSDLALATDLAELLLNINVFHPFREGNGRTQRLFISLLAKQKRKIIHLSRSDPMYAKYMRASIADDRQAMTHVILDSFD